LASFGFASGGLAFPRLVGAPFVARQGIPGITGRFGLNEKMGGLWMLSDGGGIEIGVFGGEPTLIKFGGVQPNPLRTG
jgi:hypothetical protein